MNRIIIAYLNKEVEFVVCSWIKETGLANCSENSLCTGAALRLGEKALMDTFCPHHHHPHWDL